MPKKYTYSRKSTFIDKSLHKWLKGYCQTKGRRLYDLLNEIIQDWKDRNGGK